MRISGEVMWIMARLALLVCTIYELVLFPRQQTNLDWSACLISGVLAPVAILAWFTVKVRGKKLADSNPLSWRTPFLPMSRHPFPFWHFACQVLIAGGAAAMLRDAIAKDGREAFGGTFLVTGVSIWIAVGIAAARWKRAVS